jgi:hypothetical protein
VVFLLSTAHYHTYGSGTYLAVAIYCLSCFLCFFVSLFLTYECLSLLSTTLALAFPFFCVNAIQFILFFYTFFCSNFSPFLIFNFVAACACPPVAWVPHHRFRQCSSGARRVRHIRCWIVLFVK